MPHARVSPDVICYSMAIGASSGEEQWERSLPLGLLGLRVLGFRALGL